MTLIRSQSPTPAPPQRNWPPDNWEHAELHKKIRDAIASLPTYFRTETSISGIPATDIHTLSTALGATIEDQFVRTLNSIRHVWDPDEKYALYSFHRQSQTFPDVLLKKPGSAPLMGIEMKGWYLLSLEGEPSYRFSTTTAVCNTQDLIVLVPWALSNVISGTPIAFVPYIEPAIYAADYRNHWWMYIRRSTSSRDINRPENVQPYPNKSDKINDMPVSDSGGNFGRFARTGIMDSYLEEMMELELCGVQVEHWLSFFKSFQGIKDSQEIKNKIDRLSAKISSSRNMPNQILSSLLAIVSELEKLAETKASS